MRAARFLHTLDLAHVEVIAVVRRKLSRGEVDAVRAGEAFTDFQATPIRRHAAAPLTARIWSLRSTHSAYDAAYVALAEVLGAPLVTTDTRLARSHGHDAVIVEA
jgi:predicted nucleic acid-binding protein